MTEDNRACKEFINRRTLPSNYESYSARPINCANCRRWNGKKCREIWVKEWARYG